MATSTRNPVCCSAVGNGRWLQETYETASGDAKVRAKQLRAAGYHVTVSALGSQVTPLGLIKLTMVDVRPGRHTDVCGVPTVERIDWPRN